MSDLLLDRRRLLRTSSRLLVRRVVYWRGRTMCDLSLLSRLLSLWMTTLVYLLLDRGERMDDVHVSSTLRVGLKAFLKSAGGCKADSLNRMRHTIE